MAPIRVAALGSSFAAGLGVPPYTDKTVFRSERNYANLFAQLLGGEVIDLTASGATLLNVLDTTQQSAKGKLPPQLDLLPSDTDIVTLTAGGNDIGYSKWLAIDSIIGRISRILSLLIQRLFGPRVAALDASTLAERFVAVIDRIHEIAPKAEIFLVEYVSVLGAPTAAGVDVPLDESQIRQFDDMKNVLKEGYEQAAKLRPEVKLIPMNDLSKGHEVGSEEPWIINFSLRSLFRGDPSAYHPNSLCHEAISRILYDEYTTKTDAIVQT